MKRGMCECCWTPRPRRKLVDSELLVCRDEAACIRRMGARHARWLRWLLGGHVRRSRWSPKYDMPWTHGRADDRAQLAQNVRISRGRP